jgi:hypothetical protein
MDITGEVALKLQELLTDKAFISQAVETAARSEAFKETMKEVVKDALGEQDVVVVINDNAVEKADLLTIENGIKALAVIGVASTVYHGYTYGSKLINKFRK